MDELCGPEHRTDAVQNLRLAPGFTSGPAGCSGACDRRHYCLRRWDRPGACWWKMHQLCREKSKAKVAIASGVIFIIAGVLVLFPVCWSANTIVRDFYNPLLKDAQMREFGPSLYIGWGAAALLLLGGGILCSSCLHKKID